MQTKLASQLDEGLDRLSITLSSAQQQLMVDYVLLLQKWNQAFNLTAIRDPEQMMLLHVLDSAAMLPLLDSHTQVIAQPSLLDIGTGAGIPGILLAIARPHVEFTLLDSNIKKTRFVQQAAAQLGLQNVTVAHARIEEWQAARPYDVVTCRAFASLPNIVAWTQHLLNDTTVILAMKGEWPLDELAATPDNFNIMQHQLSVPGLDAQRHVVEMQRAIVSRA